MKSLAIIACALTLGLFAAGCGDDKKDAAPTAPSGAAAAQTQKPAAANTAAPGTTAAVAANDDVPSESDFEDEAEKSINKDNVEAELDKLEKEIGQ